MSRSETDKITMHGLGQKPVQRRSVDLSSRDEPQIVAREHIRAVLQGQASASLIDDAVLVADELVTNALQHTEDGPTCMEVDVYPDIAVIEVHDAGSDAAVVRPRNCAAAPCSQLPEGGRGLHIVKALSAKWFVRSTEYGKAVVAVIKLGGVDAISPADS